MNRHRRTELGSAELENQCWNVYCFADAEHAESFMQRFGGEKFVPKQRGKGSNWARWKK